MQTLPSTEPIPTTPVEHPYLVQLEAVPARFEKAEARVCDHVIVDGRRIVRAASGDGFWHIEDDPKLTAEGAIPTAAFERDESASFIFHIR